MRTDYSVHYSAMNPSQDHESIYKRVVCEYYDAEILQIFQYVDKNLPAVDIGSGYGYMARYLLDHGFEDIHCVDNSENLLKIVTEWLPKVKALNMDGLEFLSGKQNIFGLITMIDLFEHFDSTKAVSLAYAAYKALAPNGCLFIRTPNMANILGVYSKYLDVTHYVCYTEFSLKQILTEAGFNTSNIKPLSPIWPKNSKKAKHKKLNDWIHKKLFMIQDRVTPSTFDKNLLVVAYK